MTEQTRAERSEPDQRIGIVMAALDDFHVLAGRVTQTQAAHVLARLDAAPVSLPAREERPFGLSPLEQERIRSGLIIGLEKAYWAGSEISTDFDAATEADAILSLIKVDDHE